MTTKMSFKKVTLCTWMMGRLMNEQADPSLIFHNNRHGMGGNNNNNTAKLIMTMVMMTYMLKLNLPYLLSIEIIMSMNILIGR